MRTKTAICTIAAGTLFLAGCATAPPLEESKRWSELTKAEQHVYKVNQEALRRGMHVVWINPPDRDVQRQQDPLALNDG